MAKKEPDGDNYALKGGLFAMGVAVMTGVCVSAGRDIYTTVRNVVSKWRTARRERKKEAADKIAQAATESSKATDGSPAC